MIEVARILLAAVLAIAGAAKLADRDGSRAATAAFGAPGSLAGPLATSLALVELVLAAGLLPATTAQPAAAAAALLFLAFVAATGWKLLRGERPDCHCFGALHSAPIGRATVLRNSGLALLATVVAVRAGSGITGTHVGVAAVAAAVITQAALWLQLLRRHGRALRRIEELEAGRPELPDLAPGDEIPPFALPSVGGETVSLHDLLERRCPLLLVFTDRRCGACTSLYPAVSRWQDELPGQVTVALVARGEHDELVALAEEHELEPLLLADAATFAALGAHGTPSALLVTPDGKAAGPLSYGADNIEALLLDAAEATVLEVSLHG